MFVLSKFCIIVYTLLFNLLVNSKEYCDPKFKHDSPSPNCMNYERIIKSEKDKHEIVHKINSRRNKVASGEIRSLPSATNMIKVEWNEELAASAQRWADQCGGDPDLIDSCRDLENTPVGQNIATIYGEAPQLKPSTLVDLWYVELLNVHAGIISKYQPSSRVHLEHYDYFTQLVWSDTTHVGCGAVQFQERIQENLSKNRTVYRLVCNFMPSGNKGLHVYYEGPPCTNCLLNTKCDSIYTSLCEQKDLEKDLNKQNEELNNSNAIFNTTKLIKKNITTNMTNITSLVATRSEETDVDSDISFDLFSHLFDFDRNTTTPRTENSRLCKDVMAIDEFIDLLRKKLSTDNVLKEMLLSTKTPQNDVQYSDAKVDAIVSKIYSQKTTPTTTKSTDSESVNSTLLVDLVEAVIFRNRDKISSIEEASISDPTVEARTVQMQAELGETRRNQEFTGHYFFPEEEEREENQNETTEAYYDSSVIPVSEIVLEIEELKRNRATKDFLYEILESDSYTESVTQNHIITLDNNKEPPLSAKEDEIYLWKQSNDYDQGFTKKSKRELNNYLNNDIKYHKKSLNDDNEMLINYNELLKILASDLRNLKLNEKFHCANNFASTISATSLFIFLISYIRMQLN